MLNLNFLPLPIAFECAASYEPRVVPFALILSPYSSESGMYTYQIEYVFQTPSFWSKINFSHKVRHRIKAEVIIFLLHYWAGANSTSPLRCNGGKLSPVESLVDFGRWASLPKIYLS